MNKHKKRIYGSILLLGGVALLLDRTVFSTSGAPSVAQGYTDRPLSALGVETESGPTVSVAAAPFPGRLPDLGPVGELRDAFATTEVISEALIGGSEGEGIGSLRRRGGRPGAPTPESFRENHRLGGVMLGARVSFAIVDGEWLRLGDRLNDWELIEMTGTTATFRCPPLTDSTPVKGPGGTATLSVIASEPLPKRKRR